MVTQKDIISVTRALRKKFGQSFDMQVVSPNHRGGTTLIWEEGPYDWAHQVCGGEWDWELAAAAQEFGYTYKPAPALEFPGLVVEPETGYSITISKEI